MGFPEVKLGIYPGWGGTARAPRLIGLANAVEMATSGENVDARTAFTMGLVSDVVPSDRLRQAAINLIRAENRSQQYLQDRNAWDGPIAMSETELAFLGATASAYIQQQTKGQYPAPMAALEVMMGAASSRYQRGLQGRGGRLRRAIWLAHQSCAVERLFPHGPQ